MSASAPVLFGDVPLRAVIAEVMSGISEGQGTKASVSDFRGAVAVPKNAKDTLPIQEGAVFRTI